MVDPKWAFCYNVCTVNKEEQQMGFESVVLNQVADTLIQDDLAEFCNGTLFVGSINEKEARSVFHMLSKNYGVGRVQVNPIGNTGEYAFDFVEVTQEEFSPFATVNS
jgi:hypothetical protein